MVANNIELLMLRNHINGIIIYVKLKLITMTKGHNQGPTNDPEKHTKGQHRSLSDSKKDKSPNKGRNKDGEDPSEGTKGKNSI